MHLNRTCIVSSIRLTVVLGHGYSDFTWSYVPLGAYSAFEPLGGILCTNLPIIWHMWRKRRPLLPGSSAFKSQHTSTATPGSGASRRSRLARSLGLSNADPTGNDSQARTMLGSVEEGHGTWAPDMQHSPSQPARAKFFGKVERAQAQSHEVRESGSDSAEAAPKRQSWNGTSRNGPKSPGLKKNVWEVRRK